MIATLPRLYRALPRGVAPIAVAAAIAAASPVLADTPMRASNGVENSSYSPSHSLIAIARRDLGKTGPQMGLPSRLWCGFAANRWRRLAGLSAPSSGFAFAHAAGRRLAIPVVGALLIQGRPCKRGRSCGHVSIITAVHPNGTVTAISGNDGRRVRERVRSARGIIVLPN
jgi:hypothetical protein